MQKNDILINWYPGHMAKAIREIKEKISIADILIIILDARCPISSYNEDFDLLSPHKKRLFIITKSDLMDINKKEQIAKRFSTDKLLWLDLRKTTSRNKILSALKEMSREKILNQQQKGFLISKIKIFVLGIPNTGKSTLINLIAQKKKLAVANMPGVTRSQKWISVGNYYFMDTPGILLPKFNDQEMALKLVMIGSIDAKNFPSSFLATNFLKLLAKYYPEKITNFMPFYNLNSQEISDIEAYNVFSSWALLKKYKINNKPDLNRIYKEFITYVRDLKGVTYD
ncbi:50S ribosomal subunit maturation GTPase [Mycoplasmopsis meleagridis]|uniref:Ribosome biogenesis GTPase A n=1 Tax=Mycoplasmopsis meleagridis ATCC 25294 TaxID=1264554 RepID=A0A0F5H0R7_9BACT|nr:ribosome biogenesis GTPase YlqF [Mycoplasmopsis meleagridis]KKB26916.1 50S ribosomal subunit maturation GTPase RbgA [Mycoplasmopsis meleagridis ATCC 25294]OAD18504.1 50S ribosomal subunit maturation GTPase [Mycoplasmopsis meleagridis]VEU77626.1 GTPase [Mycoplasmopsis meleagridis]